MPADKRLYALRDVTATVDNISLIAASIMSKIARLFNTVGPRQSGKYGMVIPPFVARALAGERLEIHGDGTQTRCFCHVADTIQALKGLMDATEFSGEIFNVGSTEQISILELAERVREATGSNSELTLHPVRSGLQRGNRGHAPPHPRNRQDRGGDRVAANLGASTSFSVA